MSEKETFPGCFCFDCHTPLEKGDSRYSLNVELALSGERLGLTAEEPENLPALLLATVKRGVEAENLWRCYRLHSCLKCRAGFIDRLRQWRDLSGEKPYFLKFESTVGFDELVITEKDLARDVKGEMEGLLKSIKGRSSAELTGEIFIRENFGLTEKGHDSVVDFLEDCLAGFIEDQPRGTIH